MPNRFEQPPTYIQAGDPEKENANTLFYGGQLGNRFTVKQPSGPGAPSGDDYQFKRYQYVKSDSTMTASPGKGDVAFWSDKTQYLVTTTATNRGQVAGVFQNDPAVAPITPGNYCCIQIGGRAITRVTDASIGNASAVGGFVVGSATAGRGEVIAAGTAATYPALGRCASASIGGQTLVYVDLDVPETV